MERTNRKILTPSVMLTVLALAIAVMLVFALAPVAVANAQNAFAVKELLADDLDPEREGPLEVSDLPDFQAVTVEEASAWEGAPTGTVCLLYAAKGDGSTFYGCIFSDKTCTLSGFEYTQDRNDLYDNLVSNNSRIFYTTAADPQQGEPIPLTFSQENASVEWTHGEYWNIYGSDYSDTYVFNLRSKETAQFAGEYDWEDLDAGQCFLLDQSQGLGHEFTDGSCTITLNEQIMTLTGTFVDTDGNTYALTITNGPAPVEQPSYDSLAVTLSEDYLDSLWGSTSDEELDFPTDALSITPAFSYIVDDSHEYARANYFAEISEINQKEAVTLYIRCDVGVNESTLKALFEKGENLAVTFNGSQWKSYEAPDSSSGSTHYYYHHYIYDFGVISISYDDWESEMATDAYGLWINIYGDGQSGEQQGGGTDPVAPATHVHDEITFTAWESTTSLPGEEGNYYLTADVTLSSSWNVPAGETNLCLNGHGIKVTGIDSVIYIASGRTLNVYDCGDTVHYFDRDGTNRFAINIDETEGSGRNSFVGGYIAGGKGKDNQMHGGGVYVNGTFNLYGGNIIGNTLTASDNCGAGVYCNENSIFRMYGGSISYNYAQNAGCAIFGWKNCSIEIHGGEISYNKTNWSSGSAISFWNPSGYTVSLKLYGGFIHDNSSHGGEGAVNLVSASPTVGLKGGLIVQNNTTDSTAGSAALNVCVGTNPINIEGALSSDAKICIKLSSGTGVFTSGWSTYMGSADPADYFVSENDAYQVYLLDGEAAILAEAPVLPHTHNDITFTAWESTNSLPTEAGNYYLTADVTLTSSWSVPSGTTNLCLNGYGIILGSYRIITVRNSGATLNLYDCGSTVHYYDVDAEGMATNVNDVAGEDRQSFIGGYITGGVYGGGGAVWVENATFNMYGGTILGNSASVGGGVYVSESTGTINLHGGTIMHNKATRTSNEDDGGGGVYVAYGATLNMYGGEISYNYTANNGGGVAFPSGTFRLFGGTIAHNVAAGNGGGIYKYTSSRKMYLSGAPVVGDNTAGGAGNDLYINVAGDVLNISGELTQGASVEVALVNGTGVFTSGWSDYMEGKDPSDYFVSDAEGLYFILNQDGEVEITDEAPAAHTHNDITFTAWEGTTSLPTEAGNYYLTADVTISSSWNVPTGITNLCLNGHVIAAASNVTISVITIKSGATLNLYDCDTTTHYYYVDASTYKQNRASNRDKMYDIGEIAADGPTNSRYVAATKKGSFKGGYITGGTGQGLTTNSNNISGGGFQIYGGGALNMYGGCVFGNYTSATSSQGNEGGGVYVYQNGVFNMNGGYIIGNQGGNACGGVQNLGTFTMNDGYIGHNTAGDGGWANGGGVGNSGTMTMNGGVIEGNEAGGHGGLRGKCGGAIENNGNLTINGGSIINNFCYNVGGAIYMSSSSASLTIGAGATITGNYNGETKKADNVYLGANKTITLGSALTENTIVGVTLASGTAVFTTGWNTYMTDADPAEYFFSDDESYGVYLKGGEAAILAEDPNAPAVTLGAGLLYVGGVDIVTAENYTVSGTGGGKAVYSEDEQGNRFLTLTDYVYTGQGYSNWGEGGGIDYRGGGTLTILLVGNSSITKADDSGIGRSHGIYLDNGTLIIDGTGSLTIGFADDRGGWKSNGIFNESGSFVMNGGTVVSNAGVGDESAGIYAGGGITFNGGNFTGNGNYTTDYESRGIYSGSITVNGGTVCGTAPLDNNYEARAFDGSVTINAGTLTAYGKVSFSWGVQCGANSTWTILAGDDEASATQVGGVDGSEKYVHIVAQSAGAHAHDYETAWTTDDVGHWHTCVGEGECDAPYGDYGEHSYSDDISDVAYYTCSVCHYENASRKGEYEEAQQQPVIYVASVTVDGETTEYTSLIEAYEACPEGGTIVLIENVDISNSGDEVYVTVEKDLNIDLHGHTLKFNHTLTSAQIILSGGHVLTIDNSVPEKGGVKGFIDVADDGSYVLLRNCRLIFDKTGLASTADINHIEPFFTVENIDEDGFLSLIRPMTDDELVELTEELIDEIPDPPVNNDETKDAIDEARKVYDMLPEDKKEEVENRQKLFDAEDEYARLHNVKWRITMKVKPTTSYADAITDVLAEGEKVVRIYDVTLWRIAIADGVEQDPESAQPSEIGEGVTITVKLTVPSVLIGKEYRILHVHGADDYAFVEFTADEDGKHVTIRNVDRLSDFAFVAKSSDLTPSVPGSGEQGQGGESGQGGEGEQGSGEQGQGGGEQGYKPLAVEPEITKEDDPTIENWTLTPQGGQGQGAGGQGGQGSQGTSQGGSEQGKPSDDGSQGQPAAPAVTVALEDTEPMEGLSVEVEVKTEVSEDVSRSEKSLFMASLQKDDEIAVVYEVKLIRTTTENGIEIREEIQPSDIKPGTIVVIDMTVPESLSGKPFKLVHIHSEDDVKEVTDYTVSEDGTLVTVRVDRLSEFAFIGKAESDEAVIEPNKISDGAIVGIVIGGSFGILLLGLLILFLLKREKKDVVEVSARESAPKATGEKTAKTKKEATEKAPKTKKTATEKAAAVVAAAVMPKEAVGFYRITEKDGKYAFALFYAEGDALSKEMGDYESEEAALAAIRALRGKGDGAPSENLVRGEKGVPAPKFVLDVTEKGVYFYVLIDADGQVLLQSVQYLNERRCAEDLQKAILCVTTDEIVDRSGEKRKDVAATAPVTPVEEVACEETAPVEEAPVEETVEETVEEVAAEAAEEVPTEEEAEEVAVTEDEPEGESEAPAAESISLKENIELAKVIITSSKINKQYVAEYLGQKYGEEVRLNRRANETKTGRPLPDTHYVVKAEGKNPCFVYVYEVGSTAMLLVKVDDEYGKALAAKHATVKKSAFPKAKVAWYSVIVDDSFSDEEVESILDAAYVYCGGAAREAITLRESLAAAKATVTKMDRTKKGIADLLTAEFGEGVEINTRINLTKTGLPLADTHYAVSGDKKACFVYVYEVGAVVLLVRLPEEYAAELMKKHATVKRSAFPRTKVWYSVILDDSFADDEVNEMLKTAYDWVK